MEFIIDRTSNRYKNEKPDEKPCEEAIARSAIAVDVRNAKTLKEAKSIGGWGGEFFASGVNHREEFGMVARDLGEEKTYVINIDTLQDLIALCEKYGSIILAKEYNYKGYKYSLEIYEYGWRE